MTVWELMQELSRIENPNTEIEFHVYAEFSTDTVAEFDRENENDQQEVTVDVEFDDTCDFDDIKNDEKNRYKPIVTIELAY